MNHQERRTFAIGVLGLTLILLGENRGFTQEATAPLRSVSTEIATQLSLDQVVDRMENRNAQRATALKEFEATRVYRMQYNGFPKSYTAEMVVHMNYQAPGSKDFQVISQSGPKFIVDRVFKKLLEAEKEAANSEDSRRHAALTRENYNFTMSGAEAKSYILNLDPKRKNKFLYRGKIWVDSTDFAVTRIQAEPGVNPSFFIKKTDVSHRYEKIGDFYLPAENRTQSSVRLGGVADLTIEYKDYKILKADPLPHAVAKESAAR